MKLGDAFPGNWLSNNDLGDTDNVVTIHSVKQEMIGQGQQAKLKLIVKFVEFDKPLVCNKTNATQIAKVLHLDDTDDWPGHRITLYVNDDVSFGGETVSAIRVRSKAPAQPQRQPASNGQVLSFAQAIDLCGTVGITAEELKAHLKQAGFTAYNSVACTPLVRQLVAGFEPPPPPPEDDGGEIPF